MGDSFGSLGFWRNWDDILVLRLSRNPMSIIIANIHTFILTLLSLQVTIIIWGWCLVDNTCCRNRLLMILIVMWWGRHLGILFHPCLLHLHWLFKFSLPCGHILSLARRIRRWLYRIGVLLYYDICSSCTPPLFAILIGNNVRSRITARKVWGSKGSSLHIWRSSSRKTHFSAATRRELLPVFSGCSKQFIVLFLLLRICTRVN